MNIFPPRVFSAYCRKPLSSSDNREPEQAAESYLAGSTSAQGYQPSAAPFQMALELAQPIDR